MTRPKRQHQPQVLRIGPSESQVVASVDGDGRVKGHQTAKALIATAIFRALVAPARVHQVDVAAGCKRDRRQAAACVVLSHIGGMGTQLMEKAVIDDDARNELGLLATLSIDSTSNRAGTSAARLHRQALNASTLSHWSSPTTPHPRYVP